MGGPRCQDDVVILRPRQPSDDDAIQRLNDAAFGGPDESRLIAALRDGGLAAIELVAAQGEAVVGLLLSKLAVTLGGRGLRALALAPMAVAPDRQRQGIGSALVRDGLQAAREGGWQAVIVLGHPDFYSRFGFSAGKAALLEAPFRGSAFMALELETGVLAGRGRVVYPPPFGLGG